MVQYCRDIHTFSVCFPIYYCEFACLALFVHAGVRTVIPSCAEKQIGKEGLLLSVHSVKCQAAKPVDILIEDVIWLQLKSPSAYHEMLECSSQ